VLIAESGLEASIPSAGMGLRLAGGRMKTYGADTQPDFTEDLTLTITNQGRSEIILNRDSALLLYYIAGDPDWVPNPGDSTVKRVQRSSLESEIVLLPGQKTQATFNRGGIYHCLWLKFLTENREVRVVIKMQYNKPYQGRT